MLSFEPEALSFGNVRLNQAYNTSICITNNEAHPVEFSLRCTSPRYSVSPNRVKLEAGRCQVVNVRLFVSQAGVSSATASSGPTTPAKTDFLIVKSLYFEHKVPISYVVAKRSSASSRSPSPQRGGAVGTSSVDVSARVDRGPSASVSPPRSPARRQRTAPASSSSSAHPETEEGPGGASPPRHATEADVALRRDYLAAMRRLEQERIIFDEKSEKVR